MALDYIKDEGEQAAKNELDRRYGNNDRPDTGGTGQQDTENPDRDTGSDTTMAD